MSLCLLSDRAEYYLASRDIFWSFLPRLYLDLHIYLIVEQINTKIIHTEYKSENYQDDHTNQMFHMWKSYRQ